MQFKGSKGDDPVRGSREQFCPETTEQLRTGTSVLPVVDHERFLGFFTMENLAESMMLQSASQQEGTAFPTESNASTRKHGDQERWPRLIA
jgi:hypothetical protein